MTPQEAAATIQRIADSGLDIETKDYRALTEVAQVISAQSHRLSAESVKAWLRTLPMEQRQLVIDELIACTLRTLEVSK